MERYLGQAQDQNDRDDHSTHQLHQGKLKTSQTTAKSVILWSGSSLSYLSEFAIPSRILVSFSLVRATISSNPPGLSLQGK